MPPAIAPRSAPTMPPQNRSGTNTVKCQIAMAIVNQTTAAIRRSSRSSMPPVLAPPALPPAPLIALRTLRPRLAGFATGRRPQGLRLRGPPVRAVGPIRLDGRGRRGLGGRRLRSRLRLLVRGLGCGPPRRHRRRGRGDSLAELGHGVVLGEGGQVAHLVDQPLAT